MDLNSLTAWYETVTVYALAELAPLKTRTITLKSRAPWYTDEIADAKRLRRRLERKWRSTKLDDDKHKYLLQCNVVNQLLRKAKELYYSTLIEKKSSDTRALFRVVNKLLNSNADQLYPHLQIMKTLLIRLHTFFQLKIQRICSQIVDQHQGTISPTSLAYEESIHCSTRLSSFEPLDDNGILDLIKKSTIKSCSLDPLPATIMRKCYPILVPILKNIVNLSLTSGKMPKELKSAMIIPLITKPNADTETFSNFRPVSNLRFVSKLIEKAAFLQLRDYLMRNGLHEHLQSAYKALHSTETA